MGMFSKDIADAKVVDMQLPFVRAGKYKVAIDTLKEHEGHKGRSFKLVFEITKVFNGKDPVGRRCVWILKLDNPNTKEMNISQIKAFMAAAVQSTPEELTAKDVEKIMSPENPLNGQELGLDAYENEKDGTIYVNSRWIPLNELEEENTEEKNENVKESTDD